MQLTPAQRATVRDAVMADPVAKEFVKIGDVHALLNWLNAPKVPQVLGWRVNVPGVESAKAPRYDTFDTAPMTQGKRDSWRLFLNYTQDFSEEAVRTWAIDPWGKNTVNAAAILRKGTEPITNAQAALGGAMQQTDSVAAMARVFAGPVDIEDASDIASQGSGAASVRG